MGKYTKADILRLVEEEDVEFIRMQFTDLFGGMKNLAITASHLQKALDNKIFFDGSSIDGFVDAEEGDLCLYPDYDTFSVFPWRPQHGKVVRMICDVYCPDGSRYKGDPRYILQRVVKEAAACGYTFQVGPECEFFLFHLDDDGHPTNITHEQAGYFDMSPLDFGENARRDMVLTLEEMGFEVENSHHENAPAQHEIDFKYDDAMTTADNIMTFKLVVKTIAKRHGLHATFMPKPKKDADGSGMHINMSLSRDGKNIFHDAADPNGLSREAYYFLGGLMKHVKAMTLILNPLVNSYKRLVPGFEAPTCIAWSAKNRMSLIRIPTIRGEDTRIELRSPDPSCNPYLALALCLAAGLDGIQNKIMPDDIRAEETERLPGNLKEAVEEFCRDPLMERVLGKDICQKYAETKRKEWEDYNEQVSQWELDNYLLRI